VSTQLAAAKGDHVHRGTDRAFSICHVLGLRFQEGHEKPRSAGLDQLI
jgi:hypothetical protein